MPTIKQRGDSYSVVMNVGKDDNGKWIQKRFTVKGNKPDAEKKLRALMRSVDNGQFVNPGKLTTGALKGGYGSMPYRSWGRGPRKNMPALSKSI